MNKLATYILISLLTLVAGFFAFDNYIYKEEQDQHQQEQPQPSQPEAQADDKNITYTIDGRMIPLVNGYAEMEIAPGSASKITTRYFGNEAEGDLNNDGVSDRAFILTQETGGSGTFYYAAAALKTAAGYQGTEAFFLGDRIAPQTTQIENGVIIVNYADRKPGDSFATPPSVGVSKYLVVEGNILKEIPSLPWQ